MISVSDNTLSEEKVESVLEEENHMFSRMKRRVRPWFVHKQWYGRIYLSLMCVDICNIILTQCLQET